ncbi:MAG: ribonuclease P protein component [Acholeplasmataceae bacterium]|nr:ribonuclease P protein component [Acholeplasmataceae bacterium]
MKKQYRIKKTKEIDAIIHNKKSFGSKVFVVYYKENSFDHFRYAISIGKKYGNAVMRNKIKRQIRMILASIESLPRIDYVVVVKKDANKLTYTEIERNIKNLIKKTREMEIKNETK